MTVKRSGAAVGGDAKVRHDLRNQLGIILGFSELLLADGAVSDPWRSDVEEIRKAAATALDLLGRLCPDESGAS